MLTWNLENLGPEPGRPLFPGRSQVRTERDFLAFRKYIIASQPDVVLLQEVANPKVLSLVLPLDYDYSLSPQSLSAQRLQPDIFTAIAFRRSKFAMSATFSLPTKREYLENDGARRFTRESIGFRLSTRGISVWIFSVHLKSSCDRKTMIETIDENNPCYLLRRQLETIADSIPRLTPSADAIIIGGDFNRRGLPNYEDDPYLSLLPPRVGSLHRTVVKPSQRQCPTFSGGNKDPIDYFVVYASLSLNAANRASATEWTYDSADLDYGYKLSDHCPVVLNWEMSSALDSDALR